MGDLMSLKNKPLQPNKLDFALAPLLAPFLQWAQAHDDKKARFGVAYSAGADSQALLHIAAYVMPSRVVALHVNHGMQVAAKEFEAFSHISAKALAVDLHVAHLHVKPLAGQSPEAAAREQRYQALASMAKEQGLQGVLLAHHADDQLESLLLALSRGAGLPGLSAMGPSFIKHEVAFFRPILSLSGALIRQHLANANIAYVHDPSNDDCRYTRNHIRHHVVPVLYQAFPSMAATASRSARHLAQAQLILQEVADSDLQQCGGALQPELRLLQALSPARLANALRRWLSGLEAQATPSEAQLQALVVQVQACQTRGHHIDLKVGNGKVIRQGARLHWVCAV